MENQLNETVSNTPLEPVTKKGFLANLSKRQKTSLLTLVALVIILPVTTALALLATRLNSRAYLPATPPTPPITITVTPTATATATVTSRPTPTICTNPLTNLATARPCTGVKTPVTNPSQEKQRFSGFMEASVTCQNGYKEKITSAICVEVAAIKANAQKLCNTKATCPTPTPQNNPPKILNESLKPGQINKSYQEIIQATDADKGDTVTVTALGLPAGVKLTCVGKALGRATCHIAGTPTKVGQYTVALTAKDNKGGSTTKNFTLKVVK